jgi:penicillin-binding protein 1A
MSADSAYIVKSILTQPVISGTATGAAISRMDVAAKTGTTDKYEDKWLCGFTEYYTGAAWYGFDYSESFNGTNYALINWANVMKPIHANLESKRFTKTANIVSASVCRDSGLLATELCRNDQRGSRVYTEVFIKGTVPSKSCTCHVLAKVVGTAPGNYKLATPHCPDAKELVFITRPNSATNRSWTKAEDAMYMLPEQTCEVHLEAPASPEVSPSPSSSPGASSSISPKPSGKPGESASPTVKPSTSPSAKPPETPTTTKPTTTPSATAQPSQNPTSTPTATAAPTATNT